MRKKAGFTMVELMTAMAVSMLVLLAATSAFRDAMRMNTNTTLSSDMYDNLRSGMNMMVQDLVQTGAGIPTGGIPIPSTPDVNGCNTDAATKRVERPPAVFGLTFNGPNAKQVGCNTVLPAVEPGADLGPQITSPDGTSGPLTDIITVLYVDNTLPASLAKTVSDTQPPLYNALDACFINYNYVNNGKTCLNGNNLCTGAANFIFDGSKNLTSVTLDPTCQVIGNGGVPINPGDLIMFYNANGQALQAVTSVSGQTLNFASGGSNGDAFGLNGRAGTDTAGTIKQIQNTGGGLTNVPTSITRIWMITYYLDNQTDPDHPRLMREVNFNPPQPVGEVFENLQFTYNFADGTPPSVSQPTVPTVPNPDLESQIRSVNVYMGVRSAESSPLLSGPWSSPKRMKYVRANLDTQVDLRSLAYFNAYQNTGYTTGSGQ